MIYKFASAGYNIFMSNSNSFWKKFFRSLLVLSAFGLFVLLVYLILLWTGLWESLNSIEKLRTLILDLGFYGRITFVLLQLLQVTFIPIPSTILTIGGAIIYGPLQGGLLSLSGILLGSALAFMLGKKFGKPLVRFMVGEETCEKWINFLSKAQYSFFIMMLLPIFPDDVLCLVAGLTNMSWAFFVTTNLITRPIGIFTTSYLGSGEIIPYHGWGLIVWAIIIIAAIILMWLATKYQKNIQQFISKSFRKKKQ